MNKPVDLKTVPSVSLWIDGKQKQASSARGGDITNPATGQVTKRVPFCNAADIDAAVQSAQRAFPAWRDTPALRRARILMRFRDLLDSNKDELARLITAEHGKTLTDAAGSVQRGVEVVEFAMGIPHLVKGEYSEEVGTGVDCHSLRQPIGVCAGITPFNFPVMVPLWMFPVALACGNTFILKPSEKVPSASMLMAELLKQAGLPDGVFNVVHGDKDAVDALLNHPGVKAISFVGSTPIAKYIYETATKNGKRVQALGGAKNHSLVLPDADLNMAADAIVGAAYGSAGERCMALSVVLAVDTIADALIDKIKERIPAIQVGPATEAGNEMGPLISGEHRDKVAGYVGGAEAEGATVVVDGRQGAPGGGFFLKPSLIDNAKPGMKVYDDEIFGPVLTVTRISGYQEGLQLINDNPDGNGTAIFTRDGGAARQFEFDVQVGMVGVNVPVPVPVSYY